MTDQRPGDVEVELAGRTYVLRPCFKACREIEAGTGLGLMELAQRVGAQRAGVQRAGAQRAGVRDPTLAPIMGRSGRCCASPSERRRTWRSSPARS